MYVLYRELKTFEHLESYLAQNELTVIFSNVAISWAIHDQNLDESIDISNKTTTNIAPGDFCASVDLGQYFKDNQETFHQKYAISWLKEHFKEFRKVYDRFSDQRSKDAYFALMKFCLCPYVHGTFSGLFGLYPPELNYSNNEMEGIIHNQIDIGVTKPRIQVSLLYHFSQMSNLPILLQEINPKQSFTLDLYQVEGQYRGVFTAEPEPAPVVAPVLSRAVEKERVAPVDEDLETWVASDPWDKKGVAPVEKVVSEEILDEMMDESARLQEDVSSLEEMFDEMTAEEESLADLAKEMGILEEACPWEEEEEAPVEDPFSPEESAAIDDLLREFDFPAPEKVGYGFPREQLEAKALLTQMSPVLPMMDAVSIPRDTLHKSLELLDTMVELVDYLKTNYPTEDQVCGDLLQSMVTGLSSLQNILKPIKED